MSETIFLRLLAQEEKASILAIAIAGLRDGQPSPLAYTADPASFRQVPGSPFTYWVSESVRYIFVRLSPFENGERVVKQGLATSDDFRFVRTWWETETAKIVAGAVDSNSQGFRDQTNTDRYWCHFSKGGAFSPYYADIHLVANWKQDGGEMKAFPASVIRNPDFYFRPGLTYPRRTQGGFSVRVMPAGCIFADKGPSIFATDDAPIKLSALLAIVNSQAVRAL